ncbi:MAG: hypothetical protein PHF86_12510 [Candidatus Nanoarchaeia archaeon]|nr:hypothetical protein [Candidatus Nanoarchaeia archaeon]
MTCSHTKYKIVRSHGKNSRGVPVCKYCGKVIQEEMRKDKKDNASRRRK